MANTCEIRGGKGCKMLDNCGLRSTNMRCRNFNIVPTAPIDPPSAPGTGNAVTDDGSIIMVNVNLPGVGIGIKI